MADLSVVKVGGSLFDLPDLAERLQHWLATQTGRLLLIPGGGASADVIRSLHHTHRLRETASHWLAIRMMQVHAHFLAELLTASVVVEPLDERVMILDAYEFCTRDETRPGALPHAWYVTSDAIAARVAHVFSAARLVLLKSAELPVNTTWEQAAKMGLVDHAFGAQVAKGNCQVEWCFFRRS